MTFQAAALAAFAAATATALNGGSLDILDAGGAVLATVTLDAPAGSASAAVTTLAGFPKTATAAATAAAASARLRTSAAAAYKTGISVGIPGSGAQVIVDNGAGTLAIASGQTVTISTGPTITHAGA